MKKFIYFHPRNTSYELTGSTANIHLLKVSDRYIVCLFIYTVLSVSMCCTNYDLHNKQTDYCHSLSC